MFGMHCFHDNGYMILQMWRLSMKMCDQCNMLPWSLLWQLTNDGFVLYCDQFEGCKLAPSFPICLFLFLQTPTSLLAIPSVLGSYGSSADSELNSNGIRRVPCLLSYCVIT